MNQICSVCGGELTVLGQLGEIPYYGCRQCGSDLGCVLDDDTVDALDGDGDGDDNCEDD